MSPSVQLWSLILLVHEYSVNGISKPPHTHLLTSDLRSLLRQDVSLSRHLSSRFEVISQWWAEAFKGHSWHQVKRLPSPEEKTIKSSACDRIPDWRCFQITFKWPIRDVTCKGCLNQRRRSSSWLFVELYPEPSPSLTGGSLEINRSCLCCPREVPV